jgi:DNA polymerase
VELFIDTETYSATPIKRGAYRYAQDCEVMLVSYAIDDGPVKLADLTEYPFLPLELCEAFEDAERIVAHNVMFDRTVLNAGLLPTRAERWWCTMTQAMAHSLPGKLADLCALFKLTDAHAKHDGKDYISLFCKPRPKNSKVARYTRHTHPTEGEGFKVYAMQDIAAMRELYRNKLPRWNYGGEGRAGQRELALWHLDQRINDRGVAVDLAFAEAAVEAIEKLKAASDAQIQADTDGAIDSLTQRDKVLAHLLAEYGVSLPDMRASTLERRIEDPELPEPVKELLAARLEASMTAGKKHKVVLASTCDDGRLHGLLRFCGAGRTGRWSGQVFQPQNLVRPPKYLKGGAYDKAIMSIKGGQIDTFDKPMEVISGTVRGVLVPGPGKRFAVADLSNIEGRMLAWLAGEEWKLAAYAAGDDLYIKAYAMTFGLTEAEVAADYAAGGQMRDVGKVEELALGYQGAVGAFTTMAAAFGLTFDEAFVVRLVKGWRKANSRISSFWYEAEDCVKQAILNPDTWVECRRIRIIRKGAWLRCVLPSGRTLCYPRPSVDEQGKISYDGTNQYTRKWGRIKTYGGKLVENWTQAASRDIMGWNIPLIEESGFETVLSVHDELVTEVPLGSPLNGEILAGLMGNTIPWAGGLPLAAVGKDLDRYRKA